MQKYTCAAAKQIDMVGYLETLGCHPQKIKGNDYWYLSPLRQENTPSFKVNRKLNVWYDHGSGRGGDLIDFGTQYFQCSVSDLLQKLTEKGPDFSFQQPPMNARVAGEIKDTGVENKIDIRHVRPLSVPLLLAYVRSRNIAPETAQAHCKEVDFLLHGRNYTTIAFENSAGGYELRGPDFKGSSSPKDITFINNHSRELTVFEGFFNYLSYLEMQRGQRQDLSNFLVLNSLSFFEKSRTLMEKSDRITLYLDRDAAGIGCTAMALRWDNQKYADGSRLYSGHKDLNDWLTNKPPQIKRKRGMRM